MKFRLFKKKSPIEIKLRKLLKMGLKEKRDEVDKLTPGERLWMDAIIDRKLKNSDRLLEALMGLAIAACIVASYFLQNIDHLQKIIDWFRK